jgi:hypothetical protein
MGGEFQAVGLGGIRRNGDFHGHPFGWFLLHNPQRRSQLGLSLQQFI